jgi:hypothetical protein
MAFRIPNVADTAYRDQAALASADIAILVAGFNRTGVVSGMAITPRVSGLVLDVSAGVALSKDRRIQLTNPGTVTLAAADTSHPRIDLVIARPNLSVPTAPGWSLLAVSGQPENHPISRDIDIQDGDVVLAAVVVGANAVNLATGMVLDKRLVVRDQQYYRPTAWGAAFDGVTDDSLAWQMCISSIPSYVFDAYIHNYYSNPNPLTGGCILLEGGETMITGVLDIPDKVSVVGITETFSVIGALDANFQFKHGSMTAQGFRGGVYRNFFIDGHGVANVPFYLARVVEKTFENITVRRAVQCLALFDDIQNNSFINCNFEESLGDNIQIDRGCGGNVWIRCEISSSGGKHVRFLATSGNMRLIGGVWTDTHTESGNNWFFGCILERGNEFTNTSQAITTPSYFTTTGLIEYLSGDNNGFMYCNFAAGNINNIFPIITQRKPNVNLNSTNLHIVSCYIQGRRSPTTGDGLPDPVTGESSNVVYHTLYDGAGVVDISFEGNNKWQNLAAGFHVDGSVVVKMPGTFPGWNSIGASGTPTAGEKYTNTTTAAAQFEDAVQRVPEIPLNIMANSGTDPVLKIWQNITSAFHRAEIRAGGGYFIGSGGSAPAAVGFDRSTIYTQSIGSPPTAVAGMVIYGNAAWLRATTGNTFVGLAVGDNGAMRLGKYWNASGAIPTVLPSVTPGVIGAQAQFSGTFTVTGIPVGTVVTLAFDQVLPAGVILTGQVTATNTVTYRFINTFAAPSSSIPTGNLSLAGFQNNPNL